MSRRKIWEEHRRGLLSQKFGWGGHWPSALHHQVHFSVLRTRKNTNSIRIRRTTSRTFLGSISAKLSMNTCSGGISRHMVSHSRKVSIKGSNFPKPLFLRYNKKAQLLSCRWQTRATLAKSLHGLRKSSGVVSCIARLPIDSLPMVSYCVLYSNCL